MNMSSESYARYVKARAPRSPIRRDCLWAYLAGGGICLVAEGLNQIFMLAAGMTRENASSLTAVILVFIAALLTTLGLFHKIAKHAGGGTLVPITGFANAVASSAIDNRAEGLITGVGAKIFTVAGPVLLYGTAAGTLYGVIYWIVGRFL